MNFEDQQKKENWKRLGKMILALIAFVIVLIFFISYSYESEEMEKSYDMDKEEEEMLQELNGY